MSLIWWSLQARVHNPVIYLVVIDKFLLPAVRETIPEETEHVRDNYGEESHLENVYNSQNRTIIGDFIISMPVFVTFLHLVEQLLLRDKVGATEAGNSKHLEK